MIMVGSNMVQTKVIAYLPDALTVRVQDVPSSNVLASVSHDARIDWLELNARGDMLLFRDRRRRLNLFSLVTGQRSTLL